MRLKALTRLSLSYSAGRSSSGPSSAYSRVDSPNLMTSPTWRRWNSCKIVFSSEMDHQIVLLSPVIAEKYWLRRLCGRCQSRERRKHTDCRRCWQKKEKIAKHVKYVTAVHMLFVRSVDGVRDDMEHNAKKSRLLPSYPSSLATWDHTRWIQRNYRRNCRCC